MIHTKWTYDQETTSAACLVSEATWRKTINFGAEICGLTDTQVTIDVWRRPIYDKRTMLLNHNG